METISQSTLTFLLNASWQIAAVAVVAAIANRILRSSPATHRHWLWSIALLAAVLLPFASLRTTNNPAPSGISISVPDPDLSQSNARPSSAAAARSLAIPPPRTVPVAPNWAQILLFGYLAFIVWRASRFALAVWRTSRICSDAVAEEPPPPLRAVFHRCATAFGLPHVELRRSATISSSAAAGALKPVIIVSDSLWTEQSEDVLTAAIGHEFAHIARRDFAVNVLQQLLMMPIAFHPVCWWIHRHIERSREMACDEAVTLRLMTPRTYAASIVKIAASAVAVAQPGYTLGIFDGNVLEQRIRQLLQARRPDLRRARLMLFGALGTLAVCALGVSMLSLSARAEPAFQDQMRLAGEAYNAGDYRLAVERFNAALAVQPDNVNARLFLANALLSQFYANRNEVDPSLRAEARQQYERVLSSDAHNEQALAGMLALAMETRKYPEARDWAAKLIAAAPNDADGWYTSGVVQWGIVYPEYQRAKQITGAPVDQYRIPDTNVRGSFRNQYRAEAEKGLRMLDRALEIDPAHDSAMAYKNLLYRLEAAMADDETEAARLLGEADVWVKKAIDTKSHKPKTTASVAKLDVNAPPPGPASPQPRMMVAPPPPPPPPPPRDKANQVASDAAPPPPALAVAPGMVPPPPPPSSPGFYLQVMGSTGIKARALFDQLTAKGFQAAMHAGSDNLTRVVVGPYFETADLEKAKTSLEAAGFRVVRRWQ